MSSGGSPEARMSAGLLFGSCTSCRRKSRAPDCIPSLPLTGRESAEALAKADGWGDTSPRSRRRPVRAPLPWSRPAMAEMPSAEAVTIRCRPEQKKAPAACATGASHQRGDRRVCDHHTFHFAPAEARAPAKFSVLVKVKRRRGETNGRPAPGVRAPEAGPRQIRPWVDP